MALPSIIDTSNKTPGLFIKVSLGVGGQAAASAPLRILVLGNKTSAGIKADGSITQTYGTDDAITNNGQGSELHRMLRNVFKAYPGATVFAGIIAASAGVAGSNAGWTGSGTATAAGTIEYFVNGERVVYTFASGDTWAAIGAGLVVAINNNADLPVTAAGTTTVTVTAKIPGPRGNKIRVWSTITTGSGLTHAVIDAYLASGATTDTPATILDNASSQRWNIIVSPYEDATGNGLIKTHIATYGNDPLEGKRGVYVFVTQDTLANAVTLATTINDARGRCLWHYNSDVPPAELAASWAGSYARRMQNDRASNYDGVPVLAALPQRTLADRPTASEITSALNSGITPVKVSGDGLTCTIVRAITTRSRDSGSRPDYRTLDVHQVDALDAVADQIETDFAATYMADPADPTSRGFKIAPDGDVSEMPPPGVATPLTIRDLVFAITKRFDAQDSEGSAGSLGQYLINVDTNGANIACEIDAVAEGRVNVSIPADVVSLLHQAAIDLRQIG
jgi:phage tail sheath gpL-like